MRLISVFCLTTLVLWSIGYVVFIWNAISYADKYDFYSPNIVVLTGGRNRIAHALRSVNNSRKSNIFISGVYEKTSIEDILGHAKINGAHVILGKEAKNTEGNAAEIISWVKSNGIDEILLITSDYHMYRSIVELKHVSGKLKIYPCAVKSKFDFNFLRNCIKEFHKVAYVRLKILWNRF
ncbi:MAG: YdcF family protein [Holosporaceae bacterium]|nr:YdcF family protein [Holosporaceae bacterium]